MTADDRLRKDPAAALRFRLDDFDALSDEAIADAIEACEAEWHKPGADIKWCLARNSLYGIQTRRWLTTLDTEHEIARLLNQTA